MKLNARGPTRRVKQQESRNFFGGELVRGWQHSLFGADSTTEVGLQLRHDHNDVGLYHSQARVVFETVSNDRVEETETGAYVQNTTTWTPWLRSLVGLRGDDVRIHVDALQTPVNGGSWNRHQIQAETEANPSRPLALTITLQ